MYRRLRNLREDHDYTQRYVAEILSFSHTNYAKIERGEVTLTAEILIELSNLYNVSTCGDGCGSISEIRNEDFHPRDRQPEGHGTG